MKKDNKGFSLVELIVVVAIMAVLMTVLAPQLLRYVEKTRLQKDNSAIAEIANAVKIAAADERINTEIAAAGATGIVLTATQDATTGAQSFEMDLTYPAAVTTTFLENELAGVFPEDVEMTSNTYNDTTATALVMTITMNANDVVEVEVANWAAEVADPTETETF